MPRETALDVGRRFVREHERGLIVAWLALIAVVLGLGFVWGIQQRGFERVVAAYDARWPARVDEGERMFAAQRYDEAARFLEQLDADFPARSVRHRLDRERERLLTVLARSYVKLGKERRAAETCARLVAFDPRNWQNHALQAEVALAFEQGDLARTALDHVLAIHPTHLPTVETRIQLEMDASLYARVPPLWRAYVEAFRLATVDFTAGETHVVLEIQSDGLPHRFEVPFPLPEGFHGEAKLATNGWSIDVRALALQAPLRVGIAGRPELVPQSGAWRVANAADLGGGAISAKNVDASLACDIVAPQGGADTAMLEIVAYKACTESLRRMVESAYKNLLLWDELESLRLRTRVGGCLEAGSLVDDHD
ncbi:MAG TPA: bacterial transcriptional activator domain-containing protein [Planctomycetota bacterium]|nr:bacterial transcriptional activator domain-containing protein [Planctomycetota bacterium]